MQMRGMQDRLASRVAALEDERAQLHDAAARADATRAADAKTIQDQSTTIQNQNKTITDLRNQVQALSQAPSAPKIVVLEKGWTNADSQTCFGVGDCTAYVILRNQGDGGGSVQVTLADQFGESCTTVASLPPGSTVQPSCTIHSVQVSLFLASHPVRDLVAPTVSLS